MTREEPPIGSLEICQDGRPVYRSERGWEYPAPDGIVDTYGWERLQHTSLGPTQPWPPTATHPPHPCQPGCEVETIGGVVTRYRHPPTPHHARLIGGPSNGHILTYPHGTQPPTYIHCGQRTTPALADEATYIEMATYRMATGNSGNPMTDEDGTIRYVYIPWGELHRTQPPK